MPHSILYPAPTLNINPILCGPLYKIPLHPLFFAVILPELFLLGTQSCLYNVTLCRYGITLHTTRICCPLGLAKKTHFCCRSLPSFRCCCSLSFHAAALLLRCFSSFFKDLHTVFTCRRWPCQSCLSQPSKPNKEAYRRPVLCL